MIWRSFGSGIVDHNQKAEPTVIRVNRSVAAVSVRALSVLIPSVIMAIATALGSGCVDCSVSVPPTISKPGFSFAIFLLRCVDVSREIVEIRQVVGRLVATLVLHGPDVIGRQSLEGIDPIAQRNTVRTRFLGDLGRQLVHFVGKITHSGSCSTASAALAPIAPPRCKAALNSARAASLACGSRDVSPFRSQRKVEGEVKSARTPL